MFGKTLLKLTLPIAGLLVVMLASGYASATEIQQVKTPGGLEAWLVEDHTLPIVAIEFAFRGGATQDPAGKEGTANLLSGLLDEGAGKLDSQAFRTRLEELSVKLSYSASKESFHGSFRSLTGHLDEGLELLRLSIAEPRFDEEPVERIRAQVLAQLQRQSRDPRTIASRMWFANAFPDHPYGRPTIGALETIKPIDRDDLIALQKRLMARSNLVISAVGAIDAKSLATSLDKVFANLPEKPDLTEVPPVELTYASPVSFELGIPQTVIRFGGKGLKRDDDDFIAAYIMNHILGGGSFSSRLYNEVREKRGLAYSVYTYLAAYARGGVYIGSVATRADNADKVVDIIRAEIARMVGNGVTQAELDAAKDYLIGSYPLRFDTSSKIANQLVGIRLEDLGIDYTVKRNDLIAAVTIEDINRVAKRLFSDGKLIISTVGRQPKS